MTNPTPQARRPADVYFFATCVVDQFFPDAGMDAITLLERQGIRVHFPEDQTCCGQPAYSSGFEEEARRVAAQQLTLFPNDWPVVVPSGSCAGMMKHHYPTLFAADPAHKALAEKLSARVYELTQFLVEAIALCGLGGLVGMILGWGGAFAFAQVGGWPMAVSPTMIGISLGAAAAVGVIFGFFPARRAAQLDPIQALRHD